jgi:hypothetical protein
LVAESAQHFPDRRVQAVLPDPAAEHVGVHVDAYVIGAVPQPRAAERCHGCQKGPAAGSGSGTTAKPIATSNPRCCLASAAVKMPWTSASAALGQAPSPAAGMPVRFASPVTWMATRSACVGDHLRHRGSRGVDARPAFSPHRVLHGVRRDGLVIAGAAGHRESQSGACCCPYEGARRAVNLGRCGW